jgi:hemin uptake protein HemP
MKQSGNTSMKDRLPAPARERSVERWYPPRTSELPRRFKVSELLDGRREAILEHEGQEYRLRITARRKLILMK